MPTSYTSILKLAQPANGELSGTWGTVVNDNVTAMVEEAIAGKATVAMADANQTLTTANGTTSQSRCMMVECTGAMTANRNVVCPTATKLYIVNNKTTGGFSVVFKTSAGSGITVPAGTTTIVYCDGTNVVTALPTIGDVTLDGVQTLTNKTLGATTYSAGTANGVAYLDGSKTVTAGSNFTFDGTNVVVGGYATIAGMTFGKGAGSVATNTAVGYNALLVNTTGSGNTAAGYTALQANTTGEWNVAVGTYGLYSNTTGSYNVGIGYYALRLNTTGSNNIGIGEEALHSNTTGYRNLAIGSGALYQNTTSGDNTALGYSALGSNTTGSNNTGVGSGAISSNSIGIGNTASGWSAGADITTGSNNSIYGSNSGKGITTGSNNTVIGANVTGLTAALTNTIIIADGSGNKRIVVDSTGAITGADNQITKMMFIDCGLTFLDKGNSGTSTQTLDYTAGSHQKITATGNFTIATSNWPPSGNLGELLLELTNGGAFTLTWPTINWIQPSGVTTTSIATYLAANTGRTALQSSGTDFFVLWTRDAGTTIYGKLV